MVIFGQECGDRASEPENNTIEKNISTKEGKMPRFFCIICTVFIFLSLTATAFAEPAPVEPSGSGTSEDPYLISSLAELYWITQSTARWDKDYEQTADIDASDTKNWNGGKGWTPIGNGDDSLFSGSYEGAGHTIDKLYVNDTSSSRKGFFGQAGSGVTIQNLGLTNVNISSYYYVGGLVGYNEANVTNCYVTGSVSGSGAYVGGLVGRLEGGALSGSYSEASVQASASNAGGLVGYGKGSISNCYSRGDVTRSSGGGTTFGGFSGYCDGGTIAYSYSTGSVYYTDAVDPEDKGFVGGENGSPTYTNNFFDSQASNQSSSTGSTAKNTEQMKTESTFTDAGWTFGENNWGIDGVTNDGYPYLGGVTPVLASQVDLTGPATATAGAVSTVFTLTSQDGSGNATNVTSDTVFLLSSNSSGTATFYSDAAGTTVITEVTISNGSSSATFYYKDSNLGTPTVTATRSSGMDLGSDTLQVTVDLAETTLVTSATSPSVDSVFKNFKVTVTKIEMDNGTSWVEIFSGAAELDLVLVSGGTFPGISDVALPFGTYSRMKVTFRNSLPVTGTLTYSGTPYYTTAATFGGADNIAGDPSNSAGSQTVYTFRIEEWGAVGTNVEKTFDITPISVGATTDYQPTLRFTIRQTFLFKGSAGTESTYYFELSAPTVSIVEP